MDRLRNLSNLQLLLRQMGILIATIIIIIIRASIY